jgi:hypothetical protein
MTSKVVYTYPSGATQELEILPRMYRHHGIRLEGTRPIKAEVFGEISDEFLYRSLRFSLHPVHRLLIVNGKILEDIDSDRVTADEKVPQ